MSVFRVLALAVLATTVLGCPDSGTVTYECRDGWLCFPADDIPGDLFGDPKDTADSGDAEGETASPDVATDTLDEAEAGPSEVLDSSDGDTADADLPPPPPGTFGAACNENNDCNSGWCVEGPEGYVCTKTCELVCPSDWQCKGVSGAGADLTFLCLPRVNKVCVPCTEDFQCTGGKCLLIDGERQCGSSCVEDSECPDGYACNEDPEVDGGDKYCQPVTGSCQCNAETEGSVRTCIRDNAEGTCYGVETCDPTAGWQGCTANEPAAEVCDGVDNDCNALIDDGVTAPADDCVVDNEFGTCQGDWICSDPDGQSGVQFWCTAQVPSEELCDLVDNNCDGIVDETFKTNGVYVDQQNCGACGLSCDGAIPNATATTCSENGGQPRCEVVSCDPGYYLASPTTCLASTQTLCAPCETDANCEVPGDTCNELDGAKFCGRDCSADNIYGFPAGECPPGYACNDLGNGVEQCQPESNSCQCLPGDDGNSRNCVNSNDDGQCFGSQVCNSTLGWSTCTAGTPEAEICDGVDNDCNGQVDDVTGRGEACSETNDDGTCTGILDCLAEGGPDLVCTAAVPSPEVCDYADNNCDGTVDEGFGLLYESCSVGTGICQRFGFYECAADGSAEECNAVPADSEAETCNGLDDNCDGTIDEGFPDLGTICTAGSGACQNTGITICDPSGATTKCSVSGGDNTPEVCDGIDNDCDGDTDNGFVGIGQACIVGTGTCAQPGTRQCNAAQDGVECNASPLPPGIETCDGLDNDCDGATDAPLVPDACDQQLGVCAGSVKSCGGLSGWLECQNAEYGPTYEPTELTCDGLDNDCDGNIDNNLFAPACALQDGVCAGSTQSCGGLAGWTACGAAEYGTDYQAADETGQCDGLDNDCDGLVDEEFPLVGTVCQAGLGACAVAGTYVCNPAGDGVVCSAVAGTPTPELCDGIDNNCDGQIDNNVTDAPACALTAGTCAGTTQRCIGGSFQACTAAEYGGDYETTEFSCDGVDNDCDGDTDAADSDVVAPPCALQLGVCNGGQQTCGGASGWQPCTAAQYGANYQADDETGLCDNLDNDCDGDVDEEFATKGGVCADGVGACSVTGTFVCTADGTGTECSVTAPSGSNETCNGVDDDCNGNVDDNVSGGPACALTQGVCAGTTQPCNGGGFQACTAAEYGPTFQAGTEFSCDGLDNDCDGTVDDPADLTAPPCANQAGVCAGSSQACGGATGWAACDALTFAAHSTDFQANNEVGLCDDLDNDCDGLNDEDFPTKGLPCTVGEGACATVGTFVCNPAGTGVVCSATAGPSGTEICNGIDDDCDGDIDNVATPNCPLQQGVCAGSSQVCAGASGLQACTAGNYGPTFEPTEVSCDGLDNDCDGDTDADDADLPNAPCANQVGVCSGSTRVCAGGGFQACSGAASFGPNWQADESICDLLDNDCDGQVDEGFLNGGKYDQDTACGNCFTDCTDILNLPNAFGTCNSAPATPVCELNCDPGFFNLNGIVNDGCEFELRTDTIYVSNADGIDDATCGLGPNGTGGSNHPCATIDQGLDRAVALSGRDQVFVASGAYVEDVVVRNGTSIFGGYNPVTWGRDVAANLTSIFGNTAVGHRKAVRAINITAATVMDGFAVYGESVSGGGLNSYAVWIRDSNSNFTLSNNLIFAGNGGRGTSGAAGSDGSDGGNGAAGANCIDSNSNSCSGTTGSGGSGGSNGSCGGTAGGSGGTAVCPGDCNATASGANGGNPSGPGAAGTGGAGSNNWRSSAGTCTTISTCGNPNEGGNAGDGTNGGDGTAGQGCSAGNNGGAVSGGEWAGNSGANGGVGTAGGGGGGGGVGGGLNDIVGGGEPDCGYTDTLGGAGGGGGAGACGGTGAVGGGAGGGSFGIFFSSSSATNNLPSLDGNTITMGAGGNGGDGGLGGAGGLGGDGAAGGNVNGCAQNFALGPGGRGGQGGDGGHGGGGGGGCGGVSFGIFADNNSVTPDWATANTFSGTPVGGAGGQGGPSLGSSGTSGAAGATGNVRL